MHACLPRDQATYHSSKAADRALISFSIFLLQLFQLNVFSVSTGYSPPGELVPGSFFAGDIGLQALCSKTILNIPADFFCFLKWFTNSTLSSAGDTLSPYCLANESIARVIDLMTSSLASSSPLAFLLAGVK